MEIIDSANTPSLEQVKAFLAANSVIMIIISLLVIICWWRIFKKAGKGGWEAIVPIYNIYTMYKIANVPTWAFALIWIPIVNGIGILLFQIFLAIGLAKVFGKQSSFAALIIFLPLIALPILAFGKNNYYAQA